MEMSFNMLKIIVVIFEIVILLTPIMALIIFYKLIKYTIDKETNSKKEIENLQKQIDELKKED